MNGSIVERTIDGRRWLSLGDRYLFPVSSIRAIALNFPRDGIARITTDTTAYDADADALPAYLRPGPCPSASPDDIISEVYSDA